MPKLRGESSRTRRQAYVRRADKQLDGYSGERKKNSASGQWTSQTGKKKEDTGQGRLAVRATCERCKPEDPLYHLLNSRIKTDRGEGGSRKKIKAALTRARVESPNWKEIGKKGSLRVKEEHFGESPKRHRTLRAGSIKKQILLEALDKLTRQVRNRTLKEKRGEDA